MSGTGQASPSEAELPSTDTADQEDMQVDACVLYDSTKLENPWDTDSESTCVSSWDEKGGLTDDDLILPIIGKRPKKRTRTMLKSQLSEQSMQEEEKTTPISQRQQVVDAQERDADTQTLIECVKRQLKPTHHEIRPQSQYLNHLVNEFSTLDVVNGELRRTSFDNQGRPTSVLVVPECASHNIVRHLHISLAHSNTWRLQRIISALYFIPNLNVILREVYKECESCLLSQAPKYPRARKIPVADSFPTRELNVDLLCLPPSQTWRYCIVAIDMASGHIFARKLRTKESREAAAALREICYTNCFFPIYVSSDGGLEFLGEFERACKETAATHIVNSVLIKNANKSETANSRLVNLLKRTLDKAKDWPNELDKITFALNVTSMSYGGFISNPNFLFNGRSVPGIPYSSTDTENNSVRATSSVRQIMTEVTKSRLLDTPALALYIDQRPQRFHEGQIVLVWAQKILAKKLLRNGILKIKLDKYWVLAKVEKASGDNYMVKVGEDLRKVHRRQMKPHPNPP